MNNRDEKNAEEERVYDALKKMQVKPSTEFKEETFQMMHKEIELARKDMKRKGKRMMRKSMIISLSGIAAAIAFVLLLNMDVFKEGVTPERQPGEKQTDVVQEPDTEKEAPNTELEPRPESKEIVVYPEGMEEVRTYHLLDEPSLPFTTYIPDNFLVEPVTTKESVKEVRTFSKLYPYSILTVGFFAEGMSEETAQEQIAQMMSKYEMDVDSQPFPQEGDNRSLNDLVIYAGKDDTNAALALGRYDGQYFYFFSEYTLESGDGWGWVEKVFFDEWEWRDSGLPLNK